MIQGKVLLLGDSITEAFRTSELLPEAVIDNKGVFGDSTTEMIKRINTGLINSEYDRIYVLIGTNDLVRDRTDEQILGNVKIIIQLLKKYSNDIYITSILPTRDLDSRPNQRITGYNSRLKILAKDSHVNYFDLHSLFIDKDGKLKQEFTKDGLHLLPAAYEKWAEILSQSA